MSDDRKARPIDSVEVCSAMNQPIALVMTLMLEAPLLWMAFVKGYRRIEILFAIAFVPTLITHPFLWMASSALPPYINYYWGIGALELAVVLVEGYILKLLTKRRFFYCFWVSLLANAVSTVVGLWLWRHFW